MIDGCKYIHVCMYICIYIYIYIFIYICICIFRAASSEETGPRVANRRGVVEAGMPLIGSWGCDSVIGGWGLGFKVLTFGSWKLVWH